MPALMKVSFQSGKRVVRYSSRSVEYWYCSVMLSPRKTTRSPFLKKKSFGSAAAAAAGTVEGRGTAQRIGSRLTGSLLGGWAFSPCTPAARRRQPVFRGRPLAFKGEWAYPHPHG